jgi:hypothetical protein
MEKKLILVIFFFFLLIISYFTTDQWIDPDFGWHLKTGELILKKGVPKVDWYTFSMPDFPWIDHEWLSDVLIYKIYSLFGFKFLLIFFLSISIFAFLLLIKIEDFWYFLFLIALGFFSCFPYLGIRPQVITWLFLTIFLKILNFVLTKKDWRLIFLFLFLFLFWVNLHGGFFLGIFIFFLVLFLEILEKNWKNLSLVFSSLFLSFWGTLLNPYGIRIYEEVFRTIGDRNLLFSIVEWLPLFTSEVSVFPLLYLAFFLALLIFFLKEIEFKNLFFVLVFLFFAFLHQRHFPIFIIVSLPLFVKLLIKLKERITPFGYQILLSGKRKYVLILGAIVLTIYGLYPFLTPENKGLTYPSEKAISFLKELPLSENLFADYAFGGYLIWKIPERKVFIDGRMPSWRKDGKYVFGDYLKIMKREENFQEILKKYNIKIMLLKKEAKEKKEIKEKNKLSNILLKQNWLLKFFGIDTKKSLYQILIDSGWQEIFEDETVIILYKK